MRHNNTIILRHGFGEIADKGDTIFGVDSNAQEIMRWPIEQRAAALEELARHKCIYREFPGLGGRSIIQAEEWALEYCECDGDGERIDGSDFDLSDF